MVIPKGYKQTEVGIIPGDWDVKRLVDIAPLQRGFDLPKSKVCKGKYPIVFSNGVCLYHNKYKVRGPGVITGRSGTIGKIHYVNNNYWPHNTTLWVTNFFENDSKFVYYLFHTIKWNLFNSGSGVPTLNRNDVLNEKYIIPSITEQKLIAEALSHFDNMISSLIKLIKKKKAIKQGAIQDLLTGKKRLPGFAGEWSIMRFDEVFEILPNNTFTREHLSSIGYVKNVHYGDILTKYQSVLNPEFNYIPYVKSNINLSKYGVKSYVKNGDIIIADTAEDETVGKAVEVINVDCPILAGLHTLLCRPKFEFAEKFLGYYLNTDYFHNQLIPFIVGTKVSSISRRSISQTYIKVPELAEQKAIADILSDMDSEIEKLEQNLEKYQQIKQGMMEQLLTGKIRLIESEKVQTTQKTIDKSQVLKHNHQFDDAVTIAAIVNSFYSGTFPLGRKKVQKLLYLLRRKQESAVTEFKKKAAGPYADEIRYKGGEPIAKKKKYISVTTSKKGSIFAKGENIYEAIDYIDKWNLNDDINWLVSNFRHTKTDTLELLATIDMAICDLKNEGAEISLENIKKLIQSSKEWKAKLNKPFFKDSNITWAIAKCEKLFK